MAPLRVQSECSKRQRRNIPYFGITLGSDGKMAFDQTVAGLSDTQQIGAFQFFGSATTGFGGLSVSLSQISDPIKGGIAIEQNTLTQADANLQAQILTATNSINSMRQTLLQQLSQADTLIDTQTNQQNALTASV